MYGKRGNDEDSSGNAGSELGKLTCLLGDKLLP